MTMRLCNYERSIVVIFNILFVVSDNNIQNYIILKNISK